MVVVYVYGINSFLDNISEMGVRLMKNKAMRIFMKVMFLVITPVILIVTVVIAWKDREAISYDNTKFPDIVEGFGWVLELGPLVFAIVMPIPKIYHLFISEKKSTKEVFKIMMTPTKSWYDTVRDPQAEHSNKLGADGDSKIKISKKSAQGPIQTGIVNNSYDINE